MKSRLANPAAFLAVLSFISGSVAVAQGCPGNMPPRCASSEGYLCTVEPCGPTNVIDGACTPFVPSSYGPASQNSTFIDCPIVDCIDHGVFKVCEGNPNAVERYSTFDCYLDHYPCSGGWGG